MTTAWLQNVHWLGNPALAWLVAGAAALAGFVVAQLAAVMLTARLRRLAERTRRPGFATAASVAAATRGWLLLLIAVSVALDFLYAGSAEGAARIPRHWTTADWLHLLTYALVGIQAAFWLSALLVAWLRRSASGNDARVSPVMLGVLTWAAQCVVWVTLLLAVMAEGGIDITAFVASLGIGGVAVALALQNVLGDLFASISIGLDKPFEVGDSIAFEGGQGTVTRVGIKSTRVASPAGDELSIANSVLLRGLIHNQARMRERRVVLAFRLPFDTPRARIPEVTARVRAIIDGVPSTRFDRGHLAGFGEQGLEFEFVYHVLDPDYARYAAIHESICLGTLAALDDLGLAIAVPERRLRTDAATP